MSEPDFYACATLGFRQWHLSLDDAEGVAFLEGLLKYNFRFPHHRWDLGRPNRAECLRARFSPRSVPEGHGEVPGIGCSCGFYAHARRQGSNSDTTVLRAGGVVAGWGTLELHEGGFRCSVAKVLAIFAPDPARGAQTTRAWHRRDGRRWRRCARTRPSPCCRPTP